MSAPLDVAASQFTTKNHHDTYEYIKPTNADLSHRTVLVTGASKGIGQAIAIAFARARCSHIALLARGSVATSAEAVKNTAQAEGHPSPEILQSSVDLTSASSVNEAARKVQDAFGRLDILVNNAGYLETWKPIGESDPEDWWRTWEVNVKGTYLVTRAFMPLILQSTQKTLLTVTSAGAWFTMSGASAYQGSKTAQVRLNNHLMAEYGDQGLITMAIHPGGVKTDLASGMPDSMKSILGDSPELAAATVVWLTRERREWLADRYISCRWDMEELLSKKDEIVSKNLLKLGLSR